jgi:hypothetical protein
MTRRSTNLRAAVALIAFVALPTACRPRMMSTLPGPPTRAQLAHLWSVPAEGGYLYWGVGGERLAPDPSAKYTVIEVKHSGFSRGYEVRSPDRRDWSVKFPPEAGTEVVASRIHWAVGFHQPPVYYLAKWYAEKGTDPNPQEPARFREKKPKFHGLDAKDEWSYYRNPFVGTRQLAGLLVLQAMLGNSDLKDANNVIYELDGEVEGARQWYVARDLGHTFGRTGAVNAPRGDVDVFEQTPFIKGVVNGRVKFDWRGRHDALLENITPADVRWICERLHRISDRQWRDAFRAGGYSSDTSERFIRRMKQKIAEGLALAN